MSFWRLLGSSRGLAAGPWEPQRYGLFTVWDNAAALDAFETNSRIMRRYRRLAEEVWTVRLAPVRWHGVWGRTNPFAEALPTAEVDGSPWAILTRAAIRPRSVHTFLQASAPVTVQLGRQPGLIASVGLGEVPLLFQATFSLWHDLRSAQAFAYDHPLHKEVIRRTRSEGWYREDLFARFRPTASYGTWDRLDPLVGLVKE
ncbi:MAG: spheroidene monooxygenase [Herpetosiphonaceae bacterium]|nr:spheroidene monooxygenase [Herpetosiphonaceae bacterium]